MGPSDGTGTGADVCEPLLDAPGISPVEIEIRNDGPSAVLLSMACGPDYLRLAAGELVWPGGWCEGTCEQNWCGTCGGCATGYYLRIDPGQTHTTTWSGDLFEFEPVPDDCRVEFGCGAETCAVRREVPNEVTVVVDALSVGACEAAVPDPTLCACTEPGTGPCELYGGPEEVAPDRSASRSFARTDTKVVVAFE